MNFFFKKKRVTWKVYQNAPIRRCPFLVTFHIYKITNSSPSPRLYMFNTTHPLHTDRRNFTTTMGNRLCSFVLMALFLSHLAFGSLQSFDGVHPSSPDPVHHGCSRIGRNCPPLDGGPSPPARKAREVEHVGVHAGTRYRRNGPDKKSI